LYRALKDGKIGGACIDTLAVEPMVEDCILMDAPNWIITPHIAWAPVETRQRLIDIVVENIKSFYRGERLNRVV
jgi:glycerate dehydrogenase